MLNLRQTSPGRGLDLAVWRQPGGPGPGGAVEPIVSMHGRGGPGHSRHWHHRNAQWLGTESQADRPWAGAGSSSFPSGIAQAPLTLHCSLVLDRGGHTLGEVCHRGSPGPPWQRSPAVPAGTAPEPPAPLHHSPALGLGWGQQRKNDLGLLLCMGSLWPCRPDLLQSSLPSGRGIYSRAMELDWTCGFYCNNWGADPASQQGGDSHGAVRGPCPYIQPGSWLWPLPRGLRPAHWGKTWLECTPKPGLEPKILDSHSLHSDTPT